MRQPDLNVRPVTWADIERVTEISAFDMGFAPIGWTGERGGDLVCWGAILMGANGQAIALFGLLDEALRHDKSLPVKLHRRAVRTLDQARKAGITPILTVVEEENPYSLNWMWRLGFRPTGTSHDEHELWRY